MCRRYIPIVTMWLISLLVQDALAESCYEGDSLHAYWVSCSDMLVAQQHVVVQAEQNYQAAVAHAYQCAEDYDTVCGLRDEHYSWHMALPSMRPFEGCAECGYWIMQEEGARIAFEDASVDMLVAEMERDLELDELQDRRDEEAAAYEAWYNHVNSPCTICRGY